MLSLILTILLAIFSTLLGVYPTFFTVTNNGNGHFINRLNKSGWTMLILIFLVIVISTFINIRNNDDNEKMQYNLEQINTALKNKGLKYDSINNLIVNNLNVTKSNLGHGGISLTAGGNGRISGNSFDGNRFNTTVGLDYYKLENTLDSVMRIYNQLDKEAYLYAFSGTGGDISFPDAKKVIEKKGFIVTNKGFTSQIKHYTTTGIKILVSNNKLVVIIGESEPVKGR